MSAPLDVDSVLSAIPAAIPAIGAGIAGLAHTGPGSVAPFLIEGRRCAVDGSRRGTDTRVTFGSRAVLTGIDADLGPAVNVVLTPGLVRRERAGPRGVTTETLLAAPTLPLVVAQWNGAAGALPEQVLVGLDRSAHPVGGPATDPLPPPDARGVVVRTEDGRVLGIGCVPAPARIERMRDGEAFAFVLPEGAGGGPVTLVAAYGTVAEVRAALAAAAHAPAHAVRAALTAGDDGMVLETGVPDLDDAFAWARVRLHGLAARLVDASPGRSLATGLAALAVGDGESARAAHGAIPVNRPERGLLAARISSTLGDPAPALAAAEALLRSGDPPADGDASVPDALRAVAAEALADGLRYAAPEGVIAGLRRLAGAWRPTSSGADGMAAGGGMARAEASAAHEVRVRSLPMAGRPPAKMTASDAVSTDAGAATEADWLVRLLAGNPSAIPPLSRAPTSTDLRRAAGAFVSDPDAGWSLWRRALAEGLEEGPAGPCSWDPPFDTASEGTGPRTAELLLAFAHGLLGASPDAPVGRLRLAPRLPSHVRTFRVRGIPLGETRLTLAYERVGTTHRYTLTPEIASVPPLIVFEPSVPGEVVATRIDGVAAPLDARRQTPDEDGSAPSRTLVPVQLPLDDVRTVEIDVRAAGP